MGSEKVGKMGFGYSSKVTDPRGRSRDVVAPSRYMLMAGLFK